MAGEGITQGGSEPWWQPGDSDGSTAKVKEEMRYECDKRLGSPEARDCRRIVWEGIGMGKGTDLVRVGPGDGGTVFLGYSKSFFFLSWRRRNMGRR